MYVLYTHTRTHPHTYTHTHTHTHTHTYTHTHTHTSVGPAAPRGPRCPAHPSIRRRAAGDAGDGAVGGRRRPLADAAAAARSVSADGACKQPTSGLKQLAAKQTNKRTNKQAMLWTNWTAPAGPSPRWIDRRVCRLRAFRLRACLVRLLVRLLVCLLVCLLGLVGLLLTAGRSDGVLLCLFRTALPSLSLVGSVCLFVCCLVLFAFVCFASAQAAPANGAVFVDVALRPDSFNLPGVVVSPRVSTRVSTLDGPQGIPRVPVRAHVSTLGVP
jgi:hypothetical protein